MTSSMPAKKCPDCAEMVLPDARVCRHCGFRWSPPIDTKPLPSPLSTSKRMRWIIVSSAAVLVATAISILVAVTSGSDTSLPPECHQVLSLMEGRVSSTKLAEAKSALQMTSDSKEVCAELLRSGKTPAQLEGDIQVAEILINTTLANALDAHYRRRLVFPESLDALVEAKRIQPHETADPWDTPLSYTTTPTSFKLCSAGPDRRFGSDDDLCNSRDYTPRAP